MSDGERTKSGKRLARDLKKIRQERGLTVEEIHEETKIPVALIESFEESGLFEHPMFNRVYLRSFVRTYADLVGVDTNRALSALELALQGRYENDLAETAGPEEAEPAGGAAPEVSGRADTPDQAEQQEAEQSGVSAGAPEEEAKQASSAEEEAEEDTDEFSTTGKVGTTVAAGASSDAPAEEETPPSSTGAGRPSPEELPVEEEEEAGEEWTSASPARHQSEAPPADASSEEVQQPSGVSSGGSSRGISDPGSRDRSGMQVSQGVIAGAAIIVLIGVVAFFVFGSGNGVEEAPESPDASAVDTAQVEDDPAEMEERPTADVTLGEEMNFTVIAEDGPVQGIRITRDSDLRRPYWIEQGDAAVFPAQQRIVIEDELEQIRLLLEGYEYPTDQRDEQGRIVITRDDAEAFADTLSGEPFELAVEPDTNRVPSP